MFGSVRKDTARWGAVGFILLAVVLTPLEGQGDPAKSDDAFHIDDDGRVGIGTPSPGAELEVAGQTKLNGAVGVGTAPDSAQLLTIQPAPGQAPLKVTDPSGKADWMAVSPQGDVTLGGGKVAIGTGGPGVQLEVAGEAKVDGQLTVEGATTLNSQLEVKGGAKVGRNLQVGGNAAVEGAFQHRARYQRDDKPESHYDISPRYHLSLTARNYGGRTKTIPQAVLEALCADPDGCQVRLAMTGWTAGVETQHASVFFTCYYSAQTGLWRASSTDAGDANGKDNDGATQHVRNIWDTCYLTDGNYSGYKNQGDKTKGVQVLVWKGYQHPERTCECTLID